jgi:hypothetical protein
MSTARGRPTFRFSREQDGDAGDDQNDADDGKRVAESHHQSLLLHGVAECDDRLLVGGCGIAR